MSHEIPATAWHLGDQLLGRNVLVHDSVESTNTLALSFGQDPTKNGLVILAHSQTAGRGQYGRTWQAPPESSVLLSVLLFPPPALRRPALLTAWAAVSVCETIVKLTKLQAKIKWPNDVLIQGKKVCGILIEQRTTGNAEFPLATVTGIGLNVAQTPAMFAEANLPDAGSLASMSDQALAYDDVAKELIAHLDQQYHLLLEGNIQTLESHWQGRLDLLGKNVIAETVNDIHRGRLTDVAFAGVNILTDSDEIVRLSPESIRQLRTES